MEGTQFITGGSEQSGPVQIIQALPSTGAGSQQQQVIQLANGQQVVLPGNQVIQGLPQGQTIQIQGQGGQLQQIQVVQPQSVQTQGQQIVIQPPSGAGQANQLAGGQVVQTADGQTIIYQPVQQQQQQSGETPSQVQTIQLPQGGQVIQVAAPSGVQGGNVIQVPTSSATGQSGGVIMMVPGQNGVQTMQRIQLQDQELMDDQPLYVNAKQYHRILKRRQQRAKLEAAGKIPKERRKYLHESRHKHAMQRTRGDGGRFYSKEELQKIKQEKDEAAKAKATAYTFSKSLAAESSQATKTTASADIFQTSSSEHMLLPASS